jgi:DDE family transposase
LLTLASLAGIFDLDPTDDPTHGAQQLSFFNGHCDTWCYLPVMGFVSFNDEAEQMG